SKNEKNVAFAIPLRFLGALSTAHACKAGWTVPKPRPYSAPATSIIGIFGSQDKSSIAININMVPGGITYISPFLSYILPADTRDSSNNNAYEIKYNWIPIIPFSSAYKGKNEVIPPNVNVINNNNMDGFTAALSTTSNRAGFVLAGDSS